MICTTVRSGSECNFMTIKGCNFGDGICNEIINKCEGCNKITLYMSAKYCKIYPNPKVKWNFITCPLASHLKKKEETIQKINPLKASKRSKK